MKRSIIFIVLITLTACAPKVYLKKADLPKGTKFYEPGQCFESIISSYWQKYPTESTKSINHNAEDYRSSLENQLVRGKLIKIIGEVNSIGGVYDPYYVGETINEGYLFAKKSDVDEDIDIANAKSKCLAAIREFAVKKHDPTIVVDGKSNLHLEGQFPRDDPETIESIENVEGYRAQRNILALLRDCHDSRQVGTSTESWHLHIIEGQESADLINPVLQHHIGEITTESTLNNTAYQWYLAKVDLLAYWTIYYHHGDIEQNWSVIDLQKTRVTGFTVYKEPIMKIKILASDIYYVQRKSEAYTADDPGNNNSEEQSKSEPDPDAEMESDPNMIAVKSNPVSDPSVQAFREEMIRAVLKAKKKERK